jgi:hypothetical protein
MGAQGTATLAFGSTPVKEVSVAVTGQGSIVSGSLAEAWVMRASTGSNDADAHDQLAMLFELTVGDIIAGTGFTIKARSRFDFTVIDDFIIAWAWN